MKTIMHIVIMILLAIIISPVKGGNPVWEAKIKAPQVNVRAPGAFTAMALSPAPAPFDKCKRYKNKQIAGWILMPVGLGMMAGGSYMIYAGAKNIYDNTDISLENGLETKVTKKDKVLMGVGAGMGFVGAILFPTGLVMAIKGGTNYNRDCRGSSAPSRSLNLRPTGNGVNVALKF